MKNASKRTALSESQNIGTFKSYVIGFIASITLTLVAFLLVTQHLLEDFNLTYTIMGLAFVQALIQLKYFLHLDLDFDPTGNLIAFLFMVLVIGIIVIGSLWIMSHLDYNTMANSMIHEM